MSEQEFQEKPHAGVIRALRRWESWALGLAALLALGILLRYGPWLWRLLQDEIALETWIVQLGWLGPVALIALNALQIVVAPIPGYVVQIAAGFLFGPWWGGLYASLGLLLGASLAFGLARHYGRPLAARLIGGDRIDRWERLTHSTSTLVWFMLILGPTGDLPYFMAGLARVSYIRVILITVLVRVPATFVAAAAGAGVMWLTWWQMALVVVGLGILLVLFMRYQETLVEWIDRRVQRRINSRLAADAEPVD